MWGDEGPAPHHGTGDQRPGPQIRCKYRPGYIRTLKPVFLLMKNKGHIIKMIVKELIKE